MRCHPYGGGGRVTNTAISPGTGDPVQATIRVPAETDLTVPGLAHGSVTAPGTYGAVEVNSAHAEIDIVHGREIEVEATNGGVPVPGLRPLKSVPPLSRREPGITVNSREHKKPRWPAFVLVTGASSQCGGSRIRTLEG